MSRLETSGAACSEQNLHHNCKADKLMKWFVFSAGIILTVTGLAKIISIGGTAKIMLVPDPILRISYRNLFFLAGNLELTISAICFLCKNTRFNLGLIAWLATVFSVYRAGLHLVQRNTLCPCLGSMTAALHISPYDADVAMKFILAYLLFGSYFALVSLRWYSHWIRNDS